MLTRLPDWYRIVNPAPTDSVIKQREAAVTALLKELSTLGTLVAVIELAVRGIGSTVTAPQLAAIQLVTKSVRDQHPAFSQDYEQTGVDLRVCAATAVGEYISREIASQKREPGAICAGALVLSGLETRQLSEERYVRQMLQEIIDLSRRVLRQNASALRERVEVVANVPQATDIAIAQQAINTLQKAITILAAQSRADREEIDVVWWMFGRYSKTMDQPLTILEPGARAIAAGVELADLVMIPPPSNVEHFLSAVLPNSEEALSVRTLKESWSLPILKLFSSPGASMTAHVADHPSLFPLWWLTHRLIESGGAPGWEHEFEAKTSIAAGEVKPIAKWALQAFRERIAQRLLGGVEQ